MKRLFRNPFAVHAFFESSLVLAYTAPRDVLAQHLPPHLELDTFGEFGFVAAAFVDTRRLRPHGAPAWLGRDFLLAGFRIFVRYRDAHGRTLRGLYILRSETNRRSMYLLGNLFTVYRYRYTPFEISANDQTITVSSACGLHIAATIPPEGTLPELPPHSPFQAPAAHPPQHSISQRSAMQ